MRAAEVRRDERLEPSRVERRVQLAQRPLHQAQVNAADHGLASDGQRPEWAVLQPDRLGGRGWCLWREPGGVEELDDARGGLCGRRCLGHAGGHGGSPATPGTPRGSGRVRQLRQLVGEDARESGERTRVVVERIGVNREANRWTAAAGSRRRGARDETGIGEQLEMLPDGVGMQLDCRRKLLDAERFRSAS